MDPKRSPGPRRSNIPTSYSFQEDVDHRNTHNGISYGSQGYANPLAGGFHTDLPMTASALFNWQFPTANLAPSVQPHAPVPIAPTYVPPGTPKLSGSSNTMYDSHPTEAKSQYSSASFSKPPYDLEMPPGTWPKAHGRAFSTFGSMGQIYGSDADPERPDERDGAQVPRRRRGYLAHLIDLYNYYDNPGDNVFVSNKKEAVTRAANDRARLVDPLAYDDDQLIDQDDPLVTGIKKKCLDNMDEIEHDTRRKMSYKERREEQQRVRIEYNVCPMELRQKFLMTFSKALLSFGAPSHRMESQLLAAARILEVDAEFTHMPGLIMASFGDEESKSSQMHFVKCGSRVSLGKLHKLHKIYRQVVHDELSATEATEMLDVMLATGPMFPLWLRSILVYSIGGLICPLAFGGSFVDMWLAGASCLFLFLIQAFIASRQSVIYANVYEILSVIAVSFVARALSTIRSQIFCYAAISSAGVVIVLPGYLILTSSLDLATKNIMCGSIKLVYALIYTLFLGFAFQFGSDLYLLFDPSARHALDTLSARAAAVITVTGSYMPDSNSPMNPRIPHMGTFSFTPITPFTRQNIVKACYRPPDFPWYLQPFPWWTQLIIVPLFSFISSFNNEQPVTLDLFAMVFISCVSFAANKVADHFIFNRSDVVSAIGAFSVGLLGNIYSRKMRGTAFTVMVTGVLFLVPSGLSEAGGITAQDSAVQIGSAMVSVTIGITVGLFVSHALVYVFGSSKNAAVFSF